ncbi:MAG: nucleotide exchange factor GrpE [Burkholderiaceae bacterium]
MTHNEHNREPGTAAQDSSAQPSPESIGEPAEATAAASSQGTAAAPEGAARNDSDAAGADADGLSAELDALRAQVAELNDRYVRAMAEMENVRRRSTEEVSKARKFAVEAFAEAMLPVKDSLEMALKVETPSVDSLREGTEATLRQLEHAFERNQLKTLDPLGERFDPNLHQAISMVPAGQTNPPVAPQHVAMVLQRGYLIHDRVLRPALVTVAQG